MKSVKIMLLGISMMLFAAVWTLDPAASLGGAEFIILFIGLITSIIGFFSGDAKH
ncbi:hypothetical protein PghCCS26_10410 [Paenibacillus glycanilyticus]|uniref:Uncharacterized protein n=1 Tax=Paenibacillus glycanilyticus TaxID=126569 RepID=A0ABQ6NGL8_9BACL|nr:hypothetical protein [Paenibacillus glycanilyticus]GMK43914.1 hypothetical protein PghCCS26_10410 [Paenibacillus glycanilyticus]